MSEDSPLEVAVRCLGDRWSMLVVDALLGGPKRFSDLTDTVSGISPNILSQRLKHLEREGVLVSRPYSQRPVRLNYELTASGKELAGALRMLAHWGSARPDSSGGPRHEACGTPLEARWYCPTCSRSVSDTQDAEVRYV